MLEPVSEHSKLAYPDAVRERKAPCVLLETLLAEEFFASRFRQLSVAWLEERMERRRSRSEQDRRRGGDCALDRALALLAVLWFEMKVGLPLPERASAAEHHRQSINMRYKPPAIPGRREDRSRRMHRTGRAWPLRQLPAVLASTSAQADAKSWLGASAFGIVAQPAFMTKSRCSYVDLMAPNAFSLVAPSGSTCD